MKNTIITLASVAALAVTANAQTVTSPNISFLSTNASLSTDFPNANQTVDGINGGSNGVVFDTVAVNPTIFTYELSSTYDITSFYLGNIVGSPDLGVKSFTLNLKNTAGSIVGTTSATGTLAPGFQQFAVTGAGVKTVDFVINSSHGSLPERTEFSEIAFDGVATVPEPSSTALLGLGGLALILRRRK